MYQGEGSSSSRTTNHLTTVLLLTAVGLLLIRVNWPESTVGLFCGRPATLFLGGYMVIAALRDWRKRLYVKRYGIEVVGEVIEIKSAGRQRYPVVEFHLPDNSMRTVVIQQNVSLDWRILLPPLSTRQKVTLRYDLTHSTDAFIYSSFTVWLGPLLGVTAGLGLLLSIFFF